MVRRQFLPYSVRATTVLEPDCWALASHMNGMCCMARLDEQQMKGPLGLSVQKRLFTFTPLRIDRLFPTLKRSKDDGQWTNSNP